VPELDIAGFGSSSIADNNFGIRLESIEGDTGRVEVVAIGIDFNKSDKGFVIK
jgi:hypothetical protein